MSSRNGIVFKDFFPTMVEKLGAEGFMKELGNGFHLLMDREKGVITFESLKKNAALLGLQSPSYSISQPGKHMKSPPLRSRQVRCLTHAKGGE